MTNPHPSGLSARQREYLAAARARLRRASVEEILAELVATSSPTGKEGTLARLLVARLAAAGLQATYQPIDTARGNAVGRVPGSGDGASLLLYGHLDVHLTGQRDDDAPSADGQLPSMARPKPITEGDTLFGLGAGNPKGYAACIIAAALAIVDAGIPLNGELLVGLAAGGMPTNPPPGTTQNQIGHGIGCAHMLQQGVRPDFAIIGKPGHAVAWEEAGLCYFRIRVKGSFGYVGARHVLDYKNPIVDAARLIPELEDWLRNYAKRNASDYVEPQGVVGAITAGWPHKPTFIPAWADLFLDVRVSPRTDPAEVRAQLQTDLNEITQRHPEVDASLDMILAIPASRTDPNNWIIQSCIRAFEDREERRHLPRVGTSGATDAEIIRMWGVPTARLGMAAPTPEPRATLDSELNSVHLPSMMRYIETLLYAVIDTCCRGRDEIFH
jgi:acetylornithine deacetylase/succinyl-diaminopimelate desuccinylase-like protein